MRNRIVMLGATAALAAAAACGDDESGGANSVALLIGSPYAWYDTTDRYATASGMERTLQSFGVAVNSFTAVDSATLDSVLGVSQALVITAAYGNGGVLSDSLSAGAKALIRHFVDSTGGVLIIAADAPNLVVLDTLFGYAITGGGGHPHYPLNGTPAAGTPFAGGPSEVWIIEDIYPTAAASYPGTAQIIYASGTDAAVTLIPQGRGAVVVLAWDWNYPEPYGAQDGNWIEVLRRALKL